jgi:hypothetical protein
MINLISLSFFNKKIAVEGFIGKIICKTPKMADK